MKVLVDGRALTQKFNTGVQCYTREIISSFDKAGFRYDIAKPELYNRYLQHLWGLTALPYCARDYDILFCPANIAPVWLFDKVKLILTLHSVSFIKYSEAYTQAFKTYYKWVIPKALKRAERIITVSLAERDNILDIFPAYENKIDVIPNGINEVFLNRKKFGEKDKYILYVGSLSPGKNVESIIKAFMKISTHIPHKLIIACTRPPIFRDMNFKGSIDKILFKENVGEEELANLYARADLFIFPSFYESSGLPPLEAMSCGCPVIVSNIPALQERCGDAALYCDPHRVDDIAEKILLVLQNDELKYQLINKGIERAKLFRWEDSARMTIKVFEGAYGH
jgi:glycosyltransferase involved in cell wall biosynthesis